MEPIVGGEEKAGQIVQEANGWDFDRDTPKAALTVILEWTMKRVAKLDLGKRSCCWPLNTYPSEVKYPLT